MSRAGVEVKQSKSQFKCKVFEVLQDELKDPEGNEFTRYTVKHPGAVVILPLTSDGCVYLVRQYRHPIRGDILEFPAGTLEPGELPLETAKREICEEIGFSAHDWTELGTLYPAPGFCDELQYLYFAQHLSEKKLVGDDDEYIEVVKMSVSEVEAAIHSNDLVDAKSIALFFRARLKGLV